MPSETVWLSVLNVTRNCEPQATTCCALKLFQMVVASAARTLLGMNPLPPYGFIGGPLPPVPPAGVPATPPVAGVPATPPVAGVPATPPVGNVPPIEPPKPVPDTPP